MTAKLDLAAAAIAANSGVSVEEDDLLHARRSHRYGACECKFLEAGTAVNHGHQLAVQRTAGK